MTEAADLDAFILSFTRDLRMSTPLGSHGSAAPARFAAWRESVTAARVVIVGDVMLDRYWFGEVERISPEAPVPVVKIARVEERPGGAANVARNVAALGAHATLLSVTGDDEPGAALARLVRSAGVQTLFHRDAGLNTTVKLRVIGRQQRGRCPQARGVSCDVRRPARALFRADDLDHGDGRLRRDALHLAEPVAVQHHVADDQNAGAAHALAPSRKVVGALHRPALGHLQAWPACNQGMA